MKNYKKREIHQRIYIERNAKKDLHREIYIKRYIRRDIEKRHTGK